MKPGDIVRVKFTGETVQVRDKTPTGLIEVVRSRVTRDGIEYETECFDSFALESVEANIDREFAEVKYRQALMKQELENTDEGSFEKGPIQ